MVTRIENLINTGPQHYMEEKKNSPRLTDIKLCHFCVFSDNVLTTSVVVNSTTYHVDHPKLLVFHIVTDGANFGAMQAWFDINRFKGAAIEVQNVDDLTWLNALYVPILKQLQDAETHNYYFTGTHNALVSLLVVEASEVQLWINSFVISLLTAGSTGLVQTGDVCCCHRHDNGIL